MRRKRWLAAILAAGTACTALFGCGSRQIVGTEMARSGESPEKELQAWEEAKNTPYGKYPELITYTLGKMIGGNRSNMPERDTYEDNVYTRYLRECLNIQNKDVFEAMEDQYTANVDMAIASGELPDVMVIEDRETLIRLAEEGMIADLSEALENCASDGIKAMYDSYEVSALDSAMIDGRLMALPEPSFGDGPNLLWLRRDWMDKLGLEAPDTMEEAVEIIRAFVEQDPGNNGEGSTIGLVCHSDLTGETGYRYEFQLNTIFASYNAFPKQWIDDGSGNAIYGSVQPEMKGALEQLSKMYNEGLIDKQFVTRTGDDRKGLLNSGKSGAFFGNWWGAWEVADSMTLNKEARWEPYICPVGADGKVTMFTGNPNSGYVVVRKGFEHPELIVKLANMQFDYSRYEEKDDEAYKELADYSELNAGGTILDMNIDYYDAFPRSSKKVVDALESGDTSPLNRHDMGTYVNSKKYLDSLANGEESTSAGWASYNSMAAASLVAETEVNKVTPVFFGSTKSMPLKWPTLDKMEQEMLLKIITGEKPVDYFDEFVTEWNKTGGEQITEEVNQAIKQ